MKKQTMLIALSAVVLLGTATALFAAGPATGSYPPVAGGGGGYPGSIQYQTQSGKSVQLRTMKVHGHVMILVPMNMSCDVLRVAC
jgi:hypothetical protein